MYAVLLFVRLFLIRDMVGMPVGMYMKKVIARIIPVTLPAFAIPYLLHSLMQPSVLRVLAVTGVGLLAVLMSVWVLGIDKEERMIVINRLKTILKCR